MDQRALVQYISDTFAGVNVVLGEEGIAPGDTFFIYDPDRNLEPKHQFPFATIVTHDYGDFDQLLPHPVYATQSWVCVLNPSAETFQAVQPLLAEAYDRVARRSHTRTTST